MSPSSSKSKLLKILIPLAIIAIALAVLAISQNWHRNPKKPVERQPLLVEVIQPQVSSERFTVISQGNLTPRTQTLLISEVSGVVKQVSPKFVVGGFFQQGELMLEIDPISYEVALLQAQARLDAAKAKLIEEEARSEQAQKEWDMTGRSRQNAPTLALRLPQLAQAKADVKAAEADVKNAELKLARTKILAPYAAMVQEKLVDVGQYATVGAQLAKTFATDYAEVRLPIKPLDLDVIDALFLGQSIDTLEKVHFSVQQGRNLIERDGFVSRQEGIIDTSTRVSYLVAQLDDPYQLNHPSQTNPEKIILIGSFIQAAITSLNDNQVIKLPRRVLHSGNQIYLMDSNQKLAMLEVTPLRVEQEYFFLKPNAIEAGMQVIDTNIISPVVGMSLRVAKEQ